MHSLHISGNLAAQYRSPRKRALSWLELFIKKCLSAKGNHKNSTNSKINYLKDIGSARNLM